MNESEPKPTEQNIASYEKQVKKGYSELGQEGLDAKHWGTAISIFSGRRFNFYTDKAYIEQEFVDPIVRWISRKDVQSESVTLADLGGENGFLLNEISTGLKQKLPSLVVNGLVVDVDSTGKARQKFEEKKTAGERKNLEYVVADVTRLPFDNETIDVIISRMTVQYLDAQQQEAFFSEINRVLKEGGLVEIMTVADFTDKEAYNKVFLEITHIISGNYDFKRLFPTLPQLKKLAESLKDSSLKATVGSRVLDFPLSVESFADRFNLNQAQKDKMITLFEIESKKHPEMFNLIDGVICLKSRILNLRFEKIKE